MKPQAEPTPPLLSRTSIVILCSVLLYMSTMWGLGETQQVVASGAAAVGLLSCFVISGGIRRVQIHRQNRRQVLNHRIDRNIAAITLPPHTDTSSRHIQPDTVAAFTERRPRAIRRRRRWR